MNNVVVSTIVTITCNYYNLDINQLYNTNNKRPYPPARQIVWKLSKEYFKDNLSLKTLGLLFNRSHSTILQGIRSISNQIDTDKQLNKDYKEIKNLFFISQQKQPINSILNDILVSEDIRLIKNKVQLIINLINK